MSRLCLCSAGSRLLGSRTLARVAAGAGIRDRVKADILLCYASHTESKKQLVEDLLRKAKQIEYLINALPTPASNAKTAQVNGTNGQHTSGNGISELIDGEGEDFKELEAEMQHVNEEYLTALKQAGKTLSTLTTEER